MTNTSAERVKSFHEEYEAEMKRLMDWVGDAVFVEPTAEHVGGFGRVIGVVNPNTILVCFKRVLVEEVNPKELLRVC